MPTYSVGGTTPAAVTTAPYASVSCTSARRAFLREMGLFTTAATASSIGLGTPANEATPPVASTSIVPVAQDVNDATAVTTLNTAWSTAPTAPTVYDRKVTLGAAVGAGVIWKLALDERIIIKKSGWKAFQNYGAATGAALDMYVEYDE